MSGLGVAGTPFLSFSFMSGNPAIGKELIAMPPLGALFSACNTLKHAGIIYDKSLYQIQMEASLTSRRKFYLLEDVHISSHLLLRS